MLRTSRTIAMWVSLAVAGSMAGCMPAAMHKGHGYEEPVTAPALGTLHHNYTMKQLVGDQLGPAGGLLIAAAPEKFDQNKGQEAVKVSQDAEQSPMRVVDVHNTNTADLNGDGYVTLDEVIALKRAGLSDAEIANRLRATPQVFSLTPQQEHYLTDRGVSKDIVAAIHELEKLNAPLAASSQ